MRESEDGWARVIASLVRTEGPLTPARRAGLRDFAKQERLWQSCATEAGVVSALREALPAIGATVGGIYSRRGTLPPKQGPFRFPEPELTRLEKLHARQMLDSLTILARTTMGVSEFRRDVLAGRRLSQESALKFVWSFAVRTLSPDRVREEGLRLAGHRSIKTNEWHGHYLVTLKDEHPLLVLRLGMRIWSARVEDAPKDLELHVPVWPTSQIHWEMATWKRGDEPPVEIEFLPHSVFDRLWKLAANMSWSTFWTQTDAAWFILTGAPPRPAPVRIEMNYHKGREAFASRVVMSLPPWVSNVSADKAYRRARAFMVGGRPRAMNATSLERYGFVISKCGLKPSGAQLRALAAEWGKLRGLKGRGLAASERNFARDFARTREQLLRPRLGMGRKRSNVEAEHSRHLRLMRASSAEEKRLLIRIMREAREAEEKRLKPVGKPARRGKGKRASA